MQIQFQETPEQLDLIRAMGSKNRNESQAAQSAFAALLSPVLGQIYQQADTTKMFYRDWSYTIDSDPSFPIELFANVGDGHFAIWSSPSAGGLATNTVHQPIDEVKFTTYRLDSAWSILSKYARKMRLPIVAKALERLMQEVLLKTNHSAWSVMLAALAQASHTYLGASTGHVFASQAATKFTLDDLSQLLTYFRRLNSSWVGGTPVNGGGKPTDLIMSPFMMQKLRAMSYNPINTKGPNELALSTSNAGSASTVTLPEGQRAALWQSGGVPEFYGMAITEMLELDKDAAYSVLFENYIGSTDLPRITDGAASGETFNSSDDELVIVLDGSRELGLRALATDADLGSVFTLEPDDQFQQRSGKIGWYGGLEEGRMVIDSKGIAAIVV